MVAMRPVVDGPHLVRIRARAAPDPAANGQLDIVVRDSRGARMNPIAVQVWRLDGTFVDTGVLSGPMVVPPGDYHMGLARRRLRQWFPDAVSVRVRGGQVRRVELKGRRPMARVRVRAAGSRGEKFRLEIRDNGERLIYRDDEAGELTDAVWVPADLLTVTMRRDIPSGNPSTSALGLSATGEGTWRQRFNLRSARPGRVEELVMRVWAPPEIK